MAKMQGVSEGFGILMIFLFLIFCLPDLSVAYHKILRESRACKNELLNRRISFFSTNISAKPPCSTGTASFRTFRGHERNVFRDFTT